MNKNFIVTLIAGGFFAASVVGPAFATDNAATPTTTRQQPQLDPSKGLPNINLPDRIPSAEAIGERLKNLDLEAILDREGILGNPQTDPVELPEINLPAPKPELPDVRLPDRKPVEPAEVEPSEVPDVESDVDDAPEARGAGSPVKEIVMETKAEKASILAAHDGDRRAAKAELKAAQMRMVERIKASRGGGKSKGEANKGGGKRKGKANKGGGKSKRK